MRRRVTRRLIQIQAVCIWHFGWDWRAKGWSGGWGPATLQLLYHHLSPGLVCRPAQPQTPLIYSDRLSAVLWPSQLHFVGFENHTDDQGIYMWWYPDGFFYIFLPWNKRARKSWPLLSRPNKLPSAKFLVCFNIQSASMWLKVDENVVWASNSLDPGETASYSSGSKLFVYGTIVVLGSLRVKKVNSEQCRGLKEGGNQINISL